MTQKKWKCACGYIHDGEGAPERCPKCGAPAERFELLEDAAAELVESCGGVVDGFGFVVELSFLHGRRKIDAYAVNSLVRY